MLHEPMQVTRKILENHGQVTSTRERCVRQCGFIGIGSFDIVTAKKKKHHQARRPNGKKPNILTIEIAIKPVVAVSSLGFVSHSWGIANQIKSKNQKSETQSLTIARKNKTGNKKQEENSLTSPTSKRISTPRWVRPKQSLGPCNNRKQKQPKFPTLRDLRRSIHRPVQG
jgi:hypothetical protein